jgi:hypothetical protein
LASCIGFYDSPFGTKGKACPVPFWGCLECRNAVITSRKLPALIATVEIDVVGAIVVQDERHSVDKTARHRSFDHRRRQRRAVATADARTPQEPQIRDEEIHRTCILLEGHQHRGWSADVRRT